MHNNYICAILVVRSKPFNEIRIEREDVPYNILQAVCVTHPNLKVVGGALVGAAEDSEEQIDSDLNFWNANQGIPAENVCSRLDNYVPINDSQRKLLRAAQFLVGEGSRQRAMGLIAYGSPGLGKTHVSVGLAKSISADPNGGRVTYLNAATGGHSVPRNEDSFRDMADEGRGTIILDDVNSPYSLESDALRSAISAVHSVGGRLFVTSNTDNIDTFLATALKSVMDSNGSDMIRLLDRVRGLLLPVQLVGSSYRVNTRQNPWSGFTDGDSRGFTDGSDSSLSLPLRNLELGEG